jgi:6-phosphofructokinase
MRLHSNTASIRWLLKGNDMAKPKNVIIAQSGGPTPVINNSLRGVVETCLSLPEHFGTIYAGHYGIEGVLKEDLLDLSIQERSEIALLRTTPAQGAIGTCRYRLRPDPEGDLKRVVEVFKAHDIGYFFYIGGNDSMDTAHKVAQLAHDSGLDLAAIGIPKTLDNDMGDAEFRLIDHTPGYGSVARFWALQIRNLNENNKGQRWFRPVTVIQAMGRKIGFIPAAARLADPEREMPLLIFLYEAGHTLEELADAVNDMLRKRGRAIVVVNEGLEVGNLGVLRDAFGHLVMGATRTTVGQIIINYLNDIGLATRGVAVCDVPAQDQHHNIFYSSTVDLDEAYNLGCHAVSIAFEEVSGYMATILREPGPVYRVRYDKVPLELVANSEREFPQAWIASCRTDVTDDFVSYARPLIGNEMTSVPLVNGVQRFARLKPIFAEKKLPDYIPVNYR